MATKQTPAREDKVTLTLAGDATQVEEAFERVGKAAAAVAKRVPPMSEGTREELERTGTATCPFTGRKLTRADLPQ